MKEIPNLKTIQDLAESIDDEFEIESRLKRYETMNPELMEFASRYGLRNPNEATPALFVADFIVTSSEVPSGGTDEERRESIINCFQYGLKSRCESAEALMRVFFLSQKTATLIRRNNAYMAGRGLVQETGMLILKDSFLTPFLAVTAEILGKGDTGWELGILSSALNQTYPHKELLEYEGAPSHDNDSKLFQFSQKLLEEFIKQHKLEINANLVIPNIMKTSIIFITKPSKQSLISIWNPQNIFSRWVGEEEKTVVNPLLNFLNKSDEDKPLIYLRGRIMNTDNQLMLVRNPFVEGKPMTLIRTPADEINVSKVLNTLAYRGVEAQELEGSIDIEEPVIKKEVVEEEVEEVVEKSVKVEEPTGEKVTIDEPVAKQTGFFGRIKKLFGKKPETTEKTIVRKQEAASRKTPKVKEKKRKKIFREKITKTMKKKRALLPSFISHDIGVEAVGDLNLYELFDTFRESKYLIIGALESNFAAGETTFITETAFGDPSDLADILDGLDSVIEQAANHYFKEDHQILPTEILFTTRSDRRYIICLDGNEERIVGTIGETYVKDVSQWEKEEEFLQRRSLHMRTGQLLAARQHTKFDAAVERIYANTIDKDAKLSTLDHAILPLS
jgi:hypothetical protein